MSALIVVAFLYIVYAQIRFAFIERKLLKLYDQINDLRQRSSS